MLKGISTGIKTLRFRLIGWYMILLTLTLILFAVLMVFFAQLYLTNRNAATMQRMAYQVSDSILISNNFPSVVKDADFQRMLLRNQEQYFYFRIIAVDGTIFQDFTGQPTGILQGIVPKTIGFEVVNSPESGMDWQVYSVPISGQNGQVVGWVQAGQPSDRVQQQLAYLKTPLAIGIPFILVIALFGGLILAHQALKPIDHVARTAQEISVQDLSRRIQYLGPPDEIGRLVSTFNGMLDRLQKAFQAQRRFTADASHELRTPLTVMKGRVEVTLSKPRTDEEYQNTLQELGKEVDRLIHLSSNLLLLSRLGADQPLGQMNHLDLSVLLVSMLDSLQPIAENCHVGLKGAVDDRLTILGDQDQITRLFLNLLDNALKYTPAPGMILLTASKADSSILVSIADSGVGISVENLPYLCEPFYRVEADRSRATGGVGLGLAIASEIVNRHGASLEFQSEPGRGTTVLVHFPVIS